MGAWFCEEDDCPAVIPGAHPIEQGEEGWDPNEPMLCAGCGTEAAFSVVEKMILDRERELREKNQASTAFESRLFKAIHEQREKVDRVAGFVGGS